MLKDKLINQYENLYESIIDGYSKERYTTLRVNTIKSNIDEIKEILSLNNISYKELDIYKDALCILNSSEEDIRKLNIYEEGKIYLQSISSMLPPLYMDLEDNNSVLDMTAAPGGKTSLIASLKDVKITAIEKNKIRCDRLKYNLNKLGVNRVTVLNEDARNIDSFFKFDKILLDAPCSGSGTIKISDLEAFDEELIDRSIKAQEVLLNKAIEVLKVGGTLLYSTCSILKEENEKQIEKVLKKGNLEIIPLDSKDLPILPSTLEGVVTVRPTELYEGFFIAKLKKVR